MELLLGRTTGDAPHLAPRALPPPFRRRKVVLGMDGRLSERLVTPDGRLEGADGVRTGVDIDSANRTGGHEGAGATRRTTIHKELERPGRKRKKDERSCLLSGRLQSAKLNMSFA